VDEDPCGDRGHGDYGTDPQRVGAVGCLVSGQGSQGGAGPPEQSADLRAYYNKHTKTDRLDSRMLARMPLLHPEGLRSIDDLGPAESLKRAVRQRASLVERHTRAISRLDTFLELLGPDWAEALGAGSYTKTALVILSRYADPRALKRLGRARLVALLRRSSRGSWREAKADELLAAAEESLALWAAGGMDFAELADDIASEVRLITQLETEIAAADRRIDGLYDQADPHGIVRSAPGLGPTLSAAILGGIGDPRRFANLAGVRAFSGIVPKRDQSGLTDGHKGITKAGDAGLRKALFLAADHARRVDPTLAARYHRLVTAEGKHHNSAICSVASVLITRIAACWRNGQRYELRDEHGNLISEADGRAICAVRYKIDPELRAARRRTSSAAQQRTRAGRGRKESTSKAAPTNDRPAGKTTQKVA
jgi:Transposase IS116/IS110/IS902 family/Transposase